MTKAQAPIACGNCAVSEIPAPATLERCLMKQPLAVSGSCGSGGHGRGQDQDCGLAAGHRMYAGTHNPLAWEASVITGTVRQRTESRRGTRHASPRVVL